MSQSRDILCKGGSDYCRPNHGCSSDHGSFLERLGLPSWQYVGVAVGGYIVFGAEANIVSRLVLHSLLVTAYIALDMFRVENVQSAIGKNECYNTLLGCFTALDQMRTCTVFVEVPLRALLDAISKAGLEIPQALIPLVTRMRSPEWLSSVDSNVQSQYLSDYSAEYDGRTDVLIASWVAGSKS